MDNYISQQMQNWKKQIIMDPVLNYLFDTSLTAQEFLHTRILTLDQEHIVNIYTKLASLKHSISKNIQKEVETKYQAIQSSFKSLTELDREFPKSNRQHLQSSQKYLQKFNTKYELVSKGIIQWKNINKILQYSQALQKFHVNIRILKTLFKDYSKDNSQKQYLNYLKISLILKQLTQLSLKNNFQGIQIYDNQIIYIKTCKDTVYINTQKKLIQYLSKKNKLDNQIKQQIIILNNINKIKEFIVQYYKNGLKKIAQLLKKLFQTITINQFNQILKNLQNKIYQFSVSLIYLQELLKKQKLSQILINNGIPNLFIKFWDKLTEYLYDVQKWAIQQQSRDKLRQQQKFIIWKYPSLYAMLTNLSNNIHAYLIENTKFIYYQFSTKKQQLLITLKTIAILYYKYINQQWQKFIQQLKQTSQQNSIKQIIQKTKIIELTTMIVNGINNQVILLEILKKCNKYLGQIRNKFLNEKISLHGYFNKFCKQIKEIFIKNQLLLINEIQSINSFKIINRVEEQNQREVEMINQNNP